MINPEALQRTWEQQMRLWQEELDWKKPDDFTVGYSYGLIEAQRHFALAVARAQEERES